VQERLEASIVAFDAIFMNMTDYDTWRKAGNWPPILSSLEKLYKFVQHYYKRFVVVF
jgi:hypothetical protein